MNRDTKIIIPQAIESINGILFISLKEEKKERSILLEIGDVEATNIFLGMNSDLFITEVLDTHDLLIESLTRFNIEIISGILTDSDGDYWEGSLELMNLDTQESTYIDCRPTDIIVILLKLGLPIYIYETLLESYKIDEKMRVETHNENSIEKLETMLNKYIVEEDYEKAEVVKTMIQKRKGM